MSLFTDQDTKSSCDSGNDSLELIRRYIQTDNFNQDISLTINGDIFKIPECRTPELTLRDFTCTMETLQPDDSFSKKDENYHINTSDLLTSEINTDILPTKVETILDRFECSTCSSSNDDHTLCMEFGKKRSRCRHPEMCRDETQPVKKTKNIKNPNSNVSTPVGHSTSSSVGYSSRSLSFKSVMSDHSLSHDASPLRYSNRTKSLFKDIFRKPRRKNSIHSPEQHSGTPKPRWSTKSQPWKLTDMCTWIGVKGYKSLSRIYSDIIHESDRLNNSLETSRVSPHVDDIKELRSLIVEINTKHEKLCQENEELTKNMKAMSQRIEELEVKLSSQMHTTSPVATAAPCGPPPPPPPPPPMPTAEPYSVQPLKFQSQPRTVGDKQQDGNFVRRPSITPQDIKNVKLRKTKLNPLGTKAVESKPMITMEILKQKKMSLLKGRRPIASSTPKQLTDFEKCLLEDSTLAPSYLRRTSSFRSTEDLRAQAPLYRRTVCTRTGTEFNKISPSKLFNSTVSLPESGV